MRIGLFGSKINDGTVDDVVAEARAAEADGYAAYWASQIFGHDTLTVLAIVGPRGAADRARHRRRADVPAAPDGARPSRRSR